MKFSITEADKLRSYATNPREMTRQILKKEVGEDNLINMCATHICQEKYDSAVH